MGFPLLSGERIGPEADSAGHGGEESESEPVTEHIARRLYGRRLPQEPPASVRGHRPPRFVHAYVGRATVRGDAPDVSEGETRIEETCRLRLAFAGRLDRAQQLSGVTGET